MTLLELRQLYPQGVQLRGDVLVTETSESVCFHRGRSYLFKGVSASDRSFLKTFRVGFTLETDFNPRHFKMIQLLQRQRLLKPRVSDNRLIEWLSHFSNYPAASLSSLAARKVMILGCGGTGCIVAEHLVRSGINRLMLIDGGVVDAPDMNRQLAYVPQDCGRAKVDALKDRLLAVKPNVEIQTLNIHIDASEVLQDKLVQYCPDLVINCADTPVGLIHAWVADACDFTEIPALFGGVGIERGTVGPLLVSAASKQEYAQAMRRAHEQLKDNPNIPKASLAFTNTLVAVSVGFEAFKFLSGITNGAEFNKPRELDFITAGSL